MTSEQQNRQSDSCEFTSLPAAHCDLDAEGHCITCSDEAVTVRVLRVDHQAELAQVAVREVKSGRDVVEEIDVSLVDNVAPGDILLVHGGVAIERLEGVSHE
ncbi:MAG: HypC/HybG/HupF family hydrogenase formation chaperone [Ktedonobacteraceae bacterium]|nr:HypC/HybG/HupF family hydrogenase formation chaperone [Ktedonobacteraceae bacterium]